MIAAPAAPAAVQPRITVADLMELVDFTTLPTGEVRAEMEHAPSVKTSLIAPDRTRAADAMRAACTRLAAHLNTCAPSRPSRPS